jgi:aldehyde:ferredoxin oxidoreductase
MKAMDDIRQGNERGRIFAQGAARAGAHYKVARIPVIKGQSISAYDPRVIEVTGISMMITAQGADHTAGNLPVFDCKDKTTAQLVEASLGIQTACAVADSLGLCIFGRSVTNVSAELVVTALNDAHGTKLDTSFMKTLGLETLRNEWAFNKQAGFTEKDDELPEFFYAEALAPSGKTARHFSAEINRSMRELLA